MGKYLVLFYFILCVFSAHAQYCRIQKGMTAYYITQDLKKNKTLKDTSYIADVVDKGDRLIIKEVFHGDLYDSQAVKDGTNIQFRIYYKNQGITEYIILDSKSENESMKKYIYSSIALFLLGFMVQSCFQDMDHPGFDYPEELPEKPYNPMKLGLAFEDNLEDNSIYNFGITADGTPHRYLYGSRNSGSNERQY